MYNNRQYQLWPTNQYQTSNVTHVITQPLTPAQPSYQESNQVAGWDTVPYAGGGHVSQVPRQPEHHVSTYAQGNAPQHSSEYTHHQSPQQQDSYSRSQYQGHSYYGSENYQQEGWVNYDSNTSQQYSDYNQYSQSEPSYETVNQRDQSGYETIDQRGQSGYETVNQRGQSSYESMNPRSQSGYETMNQRGQSGYETMNQRGQSGYETSYEQSPGNYSQSNTYNANGLNASYESPLKVLDDRRSNEGASYNVPTSFYSKKLGVGSSYEKKREEQEDFRRPPPVKYDPNTPPDIVAKFKTNFCQMCDIKLNSRVQSQNHYEGKPHAKKLKMVLDKRFGRTTGNEEQVITNLSPVRTLTVVTSEFSPTVPENPKVIEKAPEAPKVVPAVSGIPMGFVGKSGALKGFVASSTGNLSTGLPPTGAERTNTGVLVSRNSGVKTGLGFVGVNAGKKKNKKKKKRSVDAPAGDNFDPSAPKKKKKVTDLSQLYCNCCDLSFTSQEHATEHFLGRNHQRVMHGLKPLSPDDPITPTELLKKDTDGKIDWDSSKGKGKFFCDICGIAATSSTQLEMHMKGGRHMQMKMKAMASQASGGASSVGGGAQTQSSVSSGGADDGSSLPMSFFSNKLGPSADGDDEEGDPSFFQDEAETNVEFDTVGLPTSFFSKKLTFGNNSNNNNNNTNANSKNRSNNERNSRGGGKAGKGAKGGRGGGGGGGGGGGNRKKQNSGGAATNNVAIGKTQSQSKWDMRVGGNSKFKNPNRIPINSQNRSMAGSFPFQSPNIFPMNYQNPSTAGRLLFYSPEEIALNYQNQNMGGNKWGKKQNAIPSNYQNQKSPGKKQGQKAKKKKQESNQNQDPKNLNPGLFSNVKKVKENDDETALPLSFFSNKLGGFKENTADDVATPQGEHAICDGLPMSFASNRLDISNCTNDTNENNNKNKKKKKKKPAGGQGGYAMRPHDDNVPSQNKKKKKGGKKKNNKQNPKISGEGTEVPERVTRRDDDGSSIPMSFFSNKLGGYNVNTSEEGSGPFGENKVEYNAYGLPTSFYSNKFPSFNSNKNNKGKKTNKEKGGKENKDPNATSSNITTPGPSTTSEPNGVLGPIKILSRGETLEPSEDSGLSATPGLNEDSGHSATPETIMDPSPNKIPVVIQS